MRTKLPAIAVVLILGWFLASRITILVTSYDVNHNWEEPIFLFSATELAHDGLGGLFDYQDDLNHGGSLPLLLIAVPWVQAFGTSLLTLKGIAILWSFATLCLLMITLWRFCSPGAAVVAGATFAAMSPQWARLNVTLVGSHPEALLFCVAAAGVYLAWATARRTETTSEDPTTAFLLGLFSGLAVWTAYLSLALAGPLVAVYLTRSPNRKSVAALLTGGTIGLLPWAVQNLWLRPYGATLWREHVGPAAIHAAAATNILADTVEAFGPPTGLGIAVVSATCLTWIALAATRPNDPSHRGDIDRVAILPFLLFPIGTLALLGVADLARHPNEGYYWYRFYAPFYLAVAYLFAFAFERFDGLARRLFVGAWAGLVIFGAWEQIALCYQGNTYEPNLKRDLGKGCLVFGLAEVKRAGGVLKATSGLARLEEPWCQRRAYAGIGWAMARSEFKQPEREVMDKALSSISDPQLRFAACGGANFVARHMQGKSPAQTRELIARITKICANYREH